MNSLFRNHWFDAALMAGTACVGLAVTAALALTPRDPAAAVAVVFAPWVAAGDAMAAASDAGGRILQAGRLSNIVVVLPDDAGYAARASKRGAWLVADAATLTGCVVPR